MKKKQNYELDGYRYIVLYSFIVFMKAEDIYVDIAKDVETRSDTSNYELERPSPRGRNKKKILDQ